MPVLQKHLAIEA